MAGRKNELDPSESPGSLFGGMLRHYRELRGISQPQLAARIPCDDSLISKIESGTRAPKDDLAERCDELLQTGGALGLLMPYVKRRLAEAFREGYMDYVDEEAKAVELRNFETSCVPGLLQTPAYARALMGNWAAWRSPRDDTPDTLEEALALRLERQQILTSDTPAFAFFVIDEGALLRPVGGQEVMREQLDRLEAAAELPNVVLQVAPLALGEQLPLWKSVHLLSLPDGSTVGYTESLQQGTLVRDHATVSQWQRRYALLQVAALAKDASLELIRRVRKDMYS
ncbi:helix-turn-helix domain-containing protein [Kitasatospora sp. NBC_01287]|uniref:helix-turn-helix domain-containing protein n=1 Tax=Kitasatospora sp. NBC_01287 TaxID=2903573 RepID=UPI002253E856|nr:helix-turn-helix transcriptional regulator [Kitasatospora sp. NBC_01287]MCX4746816.1 helix-turn-helix domain-containing protein [Kitasatospora sp. NBC_01287]